MTKKELLLQMTEKKLLVQMTEKKLLGPSIEQKLVWGKGWPLASIVSCSLSRPVVTFMTL